MKPLWTPSRRALITGAPALLLARSLPALGAGHGTPWSTIDGSGGYTIPIVGAVSPPSSNGAGPQYPTLLNNYVASGSPRRLQLPIGLGRQPPWSVAGVDYYVGIDRVAFPTDANLADPNTIFTGGDLVVDNVNHFWRLNGSTVHNMNGVDFTKNGPNGYPYHLFIGSTAANITISNCKFGFQSNQSVAFAGTMGIFIGQDVASTCQLTIINNIMDGGNVNPVSQTPIQTNGAGTSLFVLYNWIKNLSGIPLVINQQPVTGGNLTNGLYSKTVIAFNLSDKAGFWGIVNHLNVAEFPGCLPLMFSTISFNTVWQEPTSGGGEFYQLYRGVAVGGVTASFTGVISGNQLTVSGASGTLFQGMVISGGTTIPGTVITDNGTGTGGNGTYTVTPGQSVGSIAMTGLAPCRPQNSPVVSNNTMISSAVVSGATAWAATTAYTIGQAVNITGGAVAQYILSPQPWAANTAYLANDSIILSPSQLSGSSSGSDWYLCTTGGTSTNGAAPAGFVTTAPTQTITDGSAVFTGKFAYNPMTSGGSSPNVSGVGNNQFFRRDGSCTWVGSNLSTSYMLHGIDTAAFGYWTAFNGIGQCKNNFIDPSGEAFGNFYPHSFYQFEISNNIDMTTGSVITYPG